MCSPTKIISHGRLHLVELCDEESDGEETAYVDNHVDTEISLHALSGTFNPKTIVRIGG